MKNFRVDVQIPIMLYDTDFFPGWMVGSTWAGRHTGGDGNKLRATQTQTSPKPKGQVLSYKDCFLNISNDSKCIVLFLHCYGS